MAIFTIRSTFLALQIILLVDVLHAQNNADDSQSNNSCTVPNGAPGICVPIQECQPVITLLSSSPPMTPQLVDFLQKSRCGPCTNRNDVKICCLIVSNNQRMGRQRINSSLSLINNTHLPTECGNTLSRRIVGGKVAEITDFPWMVLLEYDTGSGKSRGCGGALISSRYVLTAAHCINRTLSKRKVTLNAVILGEYDTSTVQDCIPDGGGRQMCSDPLVNVTIEEKIVHESYSAKNKNQPHDLALLRLSREIEFTEYIQPICLPTNANLAEELWVSGWGITEELVASTVKKKLNMSPVNKSACIEQYKTALITLGDSQICVGGKQGEDTCSGDSGTPLMAFGPTTSDNEAWTVVGITSLGRYWCGQADWPGVYTKVYDYVPWILSKLRP